jgi:hypothetical protein
MPDRRQPSRFVDASPDSPVAEGALSTIKLDSAGSYLTPSPLGGVLYVRAISGNDVFRDLAVAKTEN